MIRLYVFLLVLSILGIIVWAWKERKAVIKFSNMFVCFVLMVFAFYSGISIQRAMKESNEEKVVIKNIKILNTNGDTITIY
jgi:intracellular septation protein A